MHSLFDDLFGALADESLKSRLKALIDGSAQTPGQPRDKFVLAPRGHLKIERLDAEGRVIETIEQDNMITDWALGMATQILASDLSTGSYVVTRLTDDHDLNSAYWTVEAEPIHLYRHELQSRTSSVRPWETDDVIYNNSPDPIGDQTVLRRDVVSIEIPAEFIGPYGLYYIGIGDGVDYQISVTDQRAFEFTGNWLFVDGAQYVGGHRAESRAANDTVTINFNGTKLVGYFSYAPNGANIDISVDGGEPESVSLYNATSVAGQELIIAEGLADGPHTVTITNTGTGYLSGQANYLLAIEAVRANGLVSGQAALFREIPKQQTVIDTPEKYNTTNLAPFQFTLTRAAYGIKPNSETVIVNGQELDRVSTAPTQENEYRIDYASGTLQFARPLSGVLVTYETEEPFDTGYSRAKVERPSPGSPGYPWYNVDDHVIYLIAEFPPGHPNYPVTVREVGLFDYDTRIPWAKMFSIVRPGDLVKDPDTGLRITWEIHLLG